MTSKLKSTPKFSIIIPVLNEADNINALIEHIHALHPNGNCEIIIVDGSPEQDTLRALKHKNILSIVTTKGRGLQMNTGAAHAQGDILIFLHADTELPREALKSISQVLEDDEYIGGAFDLGIKSNKLSLKIIAFGANLRTHFTRIPYGDQAIFIRADYFHKIGCYKDIPVLEDVELMHRIKRMGGKINILSERVYTSSRRWEKEGALYCTLRNWALSGLFFLGIAPPKLRRFFKRGRAAYEG